MKTSWKGSESLVAQHTMGQGCVKAAIQSAKPAARTIFDGSSDRKLSEDLASKHPMGRGVVAAAAEAMKKSRR